MALYESLEDEAVPYVLARQRARTFRGVQSVFWLRPMGHRETQAYFGRRNMEQENRRASADLIADGLSNEDVRTLLAHMDRAQNVFKNDDDLTDPADLGRMVDKMSWNDMQELITACTNRSVLEEGAKNS